MKENEKIVILVLSFLPFIMVIGNSMFIPILPTIQGKLQLTAGEAGIFLSAFSIPAAIMIPFIGYFSDRYGRKRIILLSLSLVCVGSVISFLSPFLPHVILSYFLLIIGRVIQGLGAGGTAPLAMAVIGDVFAGKTRSKALGTVEVFNGLGKMLSPFFGIIAVLIFWQSAFIFYFILAFVTFFAIFSYVEKDSPVLKMNIKEYGLSIGLVVKREFRWLFPVFFTGGAVMFILFGLLIFLSYEAESVYGIIGLMKGILFALPFGILTLSSYFSGWFIGGGLVKIKIMISLGFGLMLLVLLGGMLVHSFLMLVIILTLFSMGAGFILPCCNFFVTSNVSKKERGMVVSLYGMVRFFGVAFGPLVYSQWMFDDWWMFMYSFLIISGVIFWLYTGWLSLSNRQSVSPFAT